MVYIVSQKPPLPTGSVPISTQATEARDRERESLDLETIRHFPEVLPRIKGLVKCHFPRGDPRVPRTQPRDNPNLHQPEPRTAHSARATGTERPPHVLLFHGREGGALVRLLPRLADARDESKPLPVHLPDGEGGGRLQASRCPSLGQARIGGGWAMPTIDWPPLMSLNLSILRTMRLSFSCLFPFSLWFFFFFHVPFLRSQRRFPPVCSCGRRPASLRKILGVAEARRLDWQKRQMTVTAMGRNLLDLTSRGPPSRGCRVPVSQEARRRSPAACRVPQDSRGLLGPPPSTLLSRAAAI
ncbi:hypothetical protein LX36DRAFT_403259 [Colletotrichum falcatum]|nr:hypothetical protein LX36DRAFT_403259 [Colletotrichum falcatum]